MREVEFSIVHAQFTTNVSWFMEMWLSENETKHEHWVMSERQNSLV